MNQLATFFAIAWPPRNGGRGRSGKK